MILTLLILGTDEIGAIHSRLRRCSWELQRGRVPVARFAPSCLHRSASDRLREPLVFESAYIFQNILKVAREIFLAARDECTMPKLAGAFHDCSVPTLLFWMRILFMRHGEFDIVQSLQY